MTYLGRQINIFSNREVSVQERVVAVRDDNGHRVGVTRGKAPRDVVAGHLDPKVALRTPLRTTTMYEKQHVRTSTRPRWDR